MCRPGRFGLRMDVIVEVREALSMCESGGNGEKAGGDGGSEA